MSILFLALLGHLSGTGLRLRGAHGFAQPLETGGFRCVGQPDNSDLSHEIMAYRIP